MANPKIEVEIGAVIDGLKKGFGESVKIIETLEQQALDLDKALRAATDLPTIQGLNTQLAQTKAALAQLKTAGIEPLTKATSSYNSVGTDFARIIQDAPFGIIGVGNNITQLAQSFQVLKNQTGSTSAALKAGFASIFAPGNALVLVISLITTALTAYQMGAFDSAEETDKLDKKTKTFDQTLKELIDSLNAVNKARVEGAKGATDELVQLDLLNKTLTASNQPQSIRIAAYKKLKEEYPTILSNISQEEALANGLGEAYFKVVNAITQRAAVIAIEDKLVELAKERIDIIEKERSETDFQNKLLKDRENLLAQIASRGVEVNQNGRTLAQIFGDQTVDLALTDLGIAIINVNKELSLLGNNVMPQTLSQLNKNDKATENLQNQFLQLNLELSDFFKLSKDGTNSNKEALDSYSKSWDLYNLSQQTANKETENLTLSQNNLNKKIEETLKLVNTTTLPNKALENLGKTEVKIDEKPPVIEIPQIDNSKKSAFIKSLKDFNAEASNIVSSGTANTIGDVAFGIGQALANGTSVFKAAGRALLEGVAQIADGLGQAAIKVGIGMIAIKAAFKNPATAIAAGVALVALAGFIRAKLGGGGGSSIPSGGGGGSASVGGAGVGGGSSFVGGAQGGLFQQNRDVSGEFVVRGQDLVYVLGQANNRINKG